MSLLEQNARERDEEDAEQAYGATGRNSATFTKQAPSPLPAITMALIEVGMSALLPMFGY
jgi:hypothetical protein